MMEYAEEPEPVRPGHLSDTGTRHHLPGRPRNRVGGFTLLILRTSEGRYT